jgi:hypothetical protein
VRRIAGLGSVKGFRKDPESYGMGWYRNETLQATRQVLCRAVKPLSIDAVRGIATRSGVDRIHGARPCAPPVWAVFGCANLLS